MQCLNFLQHLLQDTLNELETIEKLLDAGTVHIKPLPGATRTTNKQIGEAA